jgi:hypothetical protein
MIAQKYKKERQPLQVVFPFLCVRCGDVSGNVSTGINTP